VTATEQAKQQHVKATSEYWDETVGRVARILCYNRNRPNCIDEDTLVRKVARRFFSISDSALYGALGSFSHGFGVKNVYGYGAYMPNDILGLMDFVTFFVGHEILDDGEPGIGYYRLGDFEKGEEFYVICGSDHPGATPYFHNCIDLLRDTYPDAKWCTLEKALETLNFHQAKQLECIELRQRIDKRFGTAPCKETVAAEKKREKEEAFRIAVADDIIQRFSNA